MPRPVDLVTGEAFPDTIGSIPWIEAAQAGALDAADVQIDRAYFSSLPTWPMLPGGAAPVGTITIFAGMVAEVDTTDTTVVVTINDYRSLTSFSMPRNYFSGMCRHMLFGPGCNNAGSNPQASYAESGTVGAGSTQAQIIAPGIATPGGSQTYTLGSLQFTSGSNEGYWAFITQWDGSAALSLLQPLPFAVEVGDTFTAYPGCPKTTTACAQFNNSPQFGGEPLIPVPETMSGG
jgi:hypothetical protein